MAAKRGAAPCDNSIPKIGVKRKSHPHIHMTLYQNSMENGHGMWYNAGIRTTRPARCGRRQFERERIY